MVDQPPQQDRRPWPHDRDRDPHDDDVPETPPTEPEPQPIEEPPPPDRRGPYIVKPEIAAYHHANRAKDRSEDRSAEEPPSQSYEATEGFTTEVESLTSGVAPSEPGTFGKYPT
jgi:hypothetical protein